LLFNLTRSKNLEKFFIEKLKNECGNVFVAKAEDIYTEIENSGLNSQYVDQSLLEPKLTFNLFILSSMSWNVNKVVTGKVPQNIQNYHLSIEKAYKIKNQGKILHYHLPFCSAEIEYKIGNKVLNINNTFNK